jgi:hypothetical protein
LEARGTYVLKPGDAEWYDTGLRATDFTRAPSILSGYPAANYNIHKNRFKGGPKWLREAE